MNIKQRLDKLKKIMQPDIKPDCVLWCENLGETKEQAIEKHKKLHNITEFEIEPNFLVFYSNDKEK